MIGQGRFRRPGHSPASGEFSAQRRRKAPFSLAPGLRRLGRAALLGLGFAAALGVGGLVVGLFRAGASEGAGRVLRQAIAWAEFGGGTAVCGVAALLLLWRPKQPGQTEDRERTASLGFSLMLSGAVPFLLGLLLSAAWRV